METREIALLKQKLNLKLFLPGSKSITNRAFLCAALARGKSRIFGALDSDDTQVMLTALKQLGIKIEKKSDYFLIHGNGGKFKKNQLTLDLHNAGTATRFLTAIMILRSAVTIITGDKRMQERPIQDLVDGLTQLGGNIQYIGKKGCPPLRISNSKFSAKEHFLVKMKGNNSSQYFSALLILGPLLPLPLRIEVLGNLVSKPYIDTTIAVLKSFGIKIKNNQYRSFEIKPQTYQSTNYYVEGDASAATYFSSLKFLHGGSMRLANLNFKKSIQGDINYPAALQQLSKQGPRGIDMGAMPDAAMTLAVTAALNQGKTKLTGLSTLRIKETDRLAALKNELEKIVIKTAITKNSITISGKKNHSVMKEDISIATYNDHRMAMCFAVLGTLLPGIKVENPACTDKTYPEFWDDLAKAYLAPVKLGNKHLVFTGMRGAGKTYLGRKLAKILRRPFLDIDLAIEKEEGHSIKNIVKKHGWDYFRTLEHKFCEKIALDAKYNKQPMVISTGGGCVLNAENMKYLKKNAINIFIFVDPQVLIQRIKSTNHRPPLQGAKKAEDEIHELWKQRRSLYYQYANQVWDNTNEKIINECLENIFI